MFIFIIVLILRFNCYIKMFNVYFNFVFLRLNCYVFFSYSNVYIFNGFLFVYIFCISVSARIIG